MKAQKYAMPVEGVQVVGVEEPRNYVTLSLDVSGLVKYTEGGGESIELRVPAVDTKVFNTIEREAESIGMHPAQLEMLLDHVQKEFDKSVIMSTLFECKIRRIAD